MAVAVSKTDFALNTHEILEQVRGGQIVIVQSCGEEQLVLLDALDYRLLLAVVAYAVGQDNNPSTEPMSETVRQYLEQQISLSKAAEVLGVSRFELKERFERLSIPIRLGSVTLTEAQQEIIQPSEADRHHLPDPRKNNYARSTRTKGWDYLTPEIPNT